MIEFIQSDGVLRPVAQKYNLLEQEQQFGTDPEKAAEAGRQGAGRKFLAQGDAGFFTQIVRIPPGFEAPVHHHDHAEVFLVLEGSCTFDGQPMSKWDLTVVEADQPYGFVAGPDGLHFLVVRGAVAGFTEVAT